MIITSNIRGVAKTIERLAGLSKEIQAAETAGLTRVAVLTRDTIVKYAGEGHPDHPDVQTGRLRSSIRYVVEPPEHRAVIGSDVDYAPFVEFGHQQMPGRFVPAIGKKLTASSVKPYPFVRPAVTEVVDGGLAVRLFSKTIKEKLKL